ncbi:hypothetical protein, partial [Cohnella sp. REN36]|uniref:hypothetical protein n=1 Tax=Cohnella sp. REN36 TaxID=2887347 RepID=UPI001D150878
AVAGEQAKDVTLFAKFLPYSRSKAGLYSIFHAYFAISRSQELLLYEILNRILHTGTGPRFLHAKKTPALWKGRRRWRQD